MINNNEFVMSLLGGSDVRKYASEESEKAVDMKVACPRFAEYVYEAQVTAIKRCLRPILEHREQYSPKAVDILLMGVLTELSTIMGNVHILYHNKKHSLNIGYVNVSEAGTGKGVITYSDCITRDINRYLIQQSKEAKSLYDTRQMLWEQEKKMAVKEKRKVDESINPGDAPQFQLMVMPATTSRSQLVLSMRACQKHGLLVKSTEINSLADAFSKEYGQYQDLFCKAQENEMVEQYFKIDGEPIIVERPMLSLKLSGTIDQYHKLFPTLNDGFASRQFHHVGDSDIEWRSQEPDYESDGYEALQNEIAKDMLALWLWQTEFQEIKVIFTPEQWKRHTEFWTKTFNEFVCELGVQYAAIPKRHAKMQMKLAAILTIMREWNDRSNELQDMPVLVDDKLQFTCKDVDFDLAEQITRTLYQHALTLSTTKVEKRSTDYKEMSDYHWTDDALKEMPDEFSSADFINLIASAPWSKSQTTAYRTLDMLVKQKKLRKLKRYSPTRYKKTKALLKKIRK